MKVLFDKNIPRQLRRLLKGYDVRTAREMLWERLANGDLLLAAEDAGFDVMVTADNNISYQQNLSDRRLALVVLSTNDWNFIRQDPALILNAVKAADPGGFQKIDIEAT